MSQSTPPEQRACQICSKPIKPGSSFSVCADCRTEAAHPEEVRMPIDDGEILDVILGLMLPASQAVELKGAWHPVVYAEDADAQIKAERAAHERTRAELGHSQQSKLRMFVWDGRGKYKVVSCANSVSEARALALEEMSLRGDLLNMRGHVEHEQPLIYHRANAELALTESGETEELNICLEAETKRRQTAEAELELLRAEVAALKGNHAD